MASSQQSADRLHPYVKVPGRRGNPILAVALAARATPGSGWCARSYGATPVRGLRGGLLCGSLDSSTARRRRTRPVSPWASRANRIKERPLTSIVKGKIRRFAALWMVRVE
jgi:hypothetical protein